MSSLQELIRMNVSLGTVNQKGWWPCVHTGCGDRGHKGNRAAFRFDDDTVGFHCFNCGVATKYDPASHRNIPTKMSQVLQDFGIDSSQCNDIILANINKYGFKSSDEVKADLKIEPPELVLPPTFYKIEDADGDDKWAEIAIDYIEYDRMLSIKQHDFMLSTQTDDLRFKKWFGRVIIPVYKNNKLVYYQGRDLTGKAIKKYESPGDSKDRVIYGFDRLFTDHDKPLYVTEGVFDAMLVNGVAIMGNKLSDAHTAWLNKTSRTKVFIPDRFGDGAKIADQCLRLGWHVAVPYETTWDSKVKDLTDAFKKYGKLYTMARISETTAEGMLAKTLIRLNCS